MARGSARTRPLSPQLQLMKCDRNTSSCAEIFRSARRGPPRSVHRKIKTQILGQPNPETKGKKNIFKAHFETYSKTHFVASSSFGYRCQNDLQKHFFNPWFLGWVAPDSGFGFFCAWLRLRVLIYTWILKNCFYDPAPHSLPAARSPGQGVDSSPLQLAVVASSPGQGKGEAP